MTKDELIELLSYFIGNPPRLQDARFRDLIDQYDSEVARLNDPAHTYDVIYDEKGKEPTNPTEVKTRK